MHFDDPDTYVQWTRCEEPGDNPTWESQCGIIQQTGFGNTPSFCGFVGKEKTPTQSTSTFASVKRIVETEYQKTHELEWSYSD